MKYGPNYKDSFGAELKLKLLESEASTRDLVKGNLRLIRQIIFEFQQLFAVYNIFSKDR